MVNFPRPYTAAAIAWAADLESLVDDGHRRRDHREKGAISRGFLRYLQRYRGGAAIVQDSKMEFVNESAYPAAVGLK